MEEFRCYGDMKEHLQRFERAAAKGHEESIWIGSVVKDVELEKKLALKKAFSETEEPLGWYFAGLVSGDLIDSFSFYKKSAEAGCSWGQVAYGGYFARGEFMERDQNVCREWLEKAVNQNNPEAMKMLGDWFGDEREDHEKLLLYTHAAAELSWAPAMKSLAFKHYTGRGGEKNWRLAAIWSAKGHYSQMCFVEY
jgi:TPR repeat protein